MPEAVIGLNTGGVQPPYDPISSTAGSIQAVNPHELTITAGGTLQFINGPTIPAVATTSPAIVNANTVNPANAWRSGTVLQLVGLDGTQPLLEIDGYCGTSTAAKFGARTARGSQASPSALLSGDEIGGMVCFGYGATGFSASNQGGFQVNAAENWSDTAQGTTVNIVATPTGGTIAAQIVGIFSAGTTATPNPQLALQVPSATAPVLTAGAGAPTVTQPSGSIYMRTNGTTDTQVYISAGGGTWNGIATQTEDIQIFTGSGTWTKPAWATANSETEIFAIGGGGGGGGGAQETFGTVGSGGAAGGGGSAPFPVKIKTSSLGSTVTVTIGAGGTSGGSGANGGQGGNTSFGTTLVAYGGGGGGAGQTAASSVGGQGGGVASAGSTAASNTPQLNLNPGGGSGSIASVAAGGTQNVGGAGSSTTGSSNGLGAVFVAGSASGGTLLSGSATAGGNAGFALSTTAPTGGLSASSGTAGAGGNATGDGALFPHTPGAAGGGANTGGTGGAGGTAGTTAYGAGGGGGGAGTVAGGAGGVGCPGYCVAITRGV